MFTYNLLEKHFNNNRRHIVKIVSAMIFFVRSPMAIIQSCLTETVQDTGNKSEKMYTLFTVEKYFQNLHLLK